MKAFYHKYIHGLFIENRFFYGIGICVFLFVSSFYIPPIFIVAQVVLVAFVIFCIMDIILLYSNKTKHVVTRNTNIKWSNGDENNVELTVNNPFGFTVNYVIVDEVPHQFQMRNFEIQKKLTAYQKSIINYSLRPTERGEYIFNNVLLFANSQIFVFSRKFTIPLQQMVKVYPTFLQLRKAHLIGVAQTEAYGSKVVQKLSSSLEFDHIKDYARGDDVRTINWKATARKGNLMVNTFNDERSQSIYCVLDMGRNMKMPFNGLTLLDYAINASLMLSHVVLQKNDKVGLLSFSQSVVNHLKPSRNGTQLNRITELLYRQKTNFMESNYEALHAEVTYNVGQRSLLLLFTNFETVSSLERKLPMLKMLARKHVVCTVIFQNTELIQFKNEQPNDIKGIYIGTIAQQFEFEKQRICKELSNNGILYIYTEPQNLTANLINKYLDLKLKRII